VKPRVAIATGAPHTEAGIHAAGIVFDGYPFFVARVTRVPEDDAILMLCLNHDGREVRIAHVTVERVLKTIRAVQAYLHAGRIAVSGLNPREGAMAWRSMVRSAQIRSSSARVRHHRHAGTFFFGRARLGARHRRPRQGESRRRDRSNYTVSRSSTSRRRDLKFPDQTAS
jgi:hypothetical protein